MPAGDAGAALDVVDDLDGAVGDVGADGEGDFAAFGGEGAVDEGDVAFVDLAVFELHGEVALGIGIEAEEEEAGGVHVEAVDDEGAGRVGDVGADARCGTILLVIAFAGHGEEAGGFVDDRVAGGGGDDGEGEWQSGGVG